MDGIEFYKKNVRAFTFHNVLIMLKIKSFRDVLFTQCIMYNCKIAPLEALYLQTKTTNATIIFCLVCQDLLTWFDLITPVCSIRGFECVEEFCESAFYSHFISN